MESGSKTQGDDADEIEVQRTTLSARIPTWFTRETRFANHLALNFDGFGFRLTVAQIPLPIGRAEDTLEAISRGPIESTILEQFFIPVPQFVEAMNKFQALIERLQHDGVFEVSTIGSEEETTEQ